MIIRRIWRKADEDQSGAQETELYYVYDDNRVVEERVYSDEDLKRDYIYGNYIDEPIYGRADKNDDGDFGDTGEQFYYCHNNLYNVTVLLDTAGAIIEAYEYKPYGKVTIYTGKGNDCAWFTSDDVTGNLTGNYYLFTGRRYEPESGWYYYRARYHEPILGRFGQRDPTGYMDGMNLYTYVSDNPVNFTDAMGLRKGKGHFEVLIDSRTGKPVEFRPLVSRDVIISIGAAGAKRQASEGARFSVLAPNTPGEVIVSFHSEGKGAKEGAKIDWLPPGTPGEVIVCWHAEKRGEGVRALRKGISEKAAHQAVSYAKMLLAEMCRDPQRFSCGVYSFPSYAYCRNKTPIVEDILNIIPIPRMLMLGDAWGYTTGGIVDIYYPNIPDRVKAQATYLHELLHVALGPGHRKTGWEWWGCYYNLGVLAIGPE